jgi:hypothetical protein
MAEGQELVAISDQFRGLPMDSLIGGPLTAACDAQLRLAYATADFIKVIGFLPPTKKDQDVGLPRTAQFQFTRPQGPAEGFEPGQQIKQETVVLDVPLLAIVRIPTLSITSVDVIFDMEVKSSFTSTEKAEAEAGMSGDVTVGWGFVKAKVHIQGKVSSHKENTRASDNSAKYHVEVHAVDSGMPEGLARVMDILHSAIAPRSITPQDTARGKPNSGQTKS